MSNIALKWLKEGVRPMQSESAPCTKPGTICPLRISLVCTQVLLSPCAVAELETYSQYITGPLLILNSRNDQLFEIFFTLSFPESKMSAKRLATTALDWGVVAAKIPAENRAAFGALKVKPDKSLFNCFLGNL